MSATSKPKPASRFVLSAVLSGTITCVLSIAFILLSILALIFRFDCTVSAADTVSGSSFLVSTVYKAYIQDDACNNTASLAQYQITTAYSVFVLACITLTAAFVCLISSFTLIAAITSESISRYLNIIVYTYVGVWLASFVVDLTFAAHFGMDYSYLSDLMDRRASAGLPMNYETDVLRVGAFMLMILTLKGFVSHAVNIALLVLLVIDVIRYAKSLDEYEHSIHKLGVIKAFQPNGRSPRSEASNQPSPGFMNNGNGGPQMNFGFMNDEDPPRSLTRENSRRERDDFSTTSFDRSYSWQQQPPPMPAPRPFSYLEEPRRPASERGASSPSEPWRRNPWPAPPPVPAPDYSPTAPRRLKSALKPGYM